MAAARPRVSGISGETAMTVDDVKNYLAGPDGPWVVLLALTVLFSIPRYPNRSLAALAPGAFAFVAYVVAKHFEFALTEQYEIIFGIFLGFRSLAQGMPSPQTTKE
jgi:hypothetical protein